MSKKILMIAAVVLYAAAAVLFAWRYLLGGADGLRIAAIIVLIAAVIVHTAYNLKYKPRSK